MLQSVILHLNVGQLRIIRSRVYAHLLSTISVKSLPFEKIGLAFLLFFTFLKKERNLPCANKMAERLEDLNLPNTVVTRIIKEALPEGIVIGKEAKLAVAKASSIFILYLTSAANTVAKNNNRKTISAADVTQAIEDIDFDQFINPLQESLETFKKNQKEKKEATVKKKLQKNEENEEAQQEDE